MAILIISMHKRWSMLDIQMYVCVCFCECACLIQYMCQFKHSSIVNPLNPTLPSHSAYIPEAPGEICTKNIYVHVCMYYACMYVCMYVCMNMLVCMYVCCIIYAYVHVYVYVCMHMYMY